jgi:tetratricopeptide (TPR) repeat protein
VSHRYLRPMAALATIVYLAVPISAQPPGASFVRGELHAETPVNFMDYRIELEELNRRSDIHHADVHFDGAFEFRHVPAGDFTLRVLSNTGIVQQELVTINPQMTQLTVRLQPLPGKQPLTPGTISLTQLRHPPDRKAVQAYTTAQRFAASGKPEKAAEELEKAVRISPEFADAYVNLAVQHMRMRRFEEAAAETARAIEIAGPDPLRLCNLAYAQINLGQVQEALVSVRAALRLDASYPQAHFLLGSMLVAEAISHLKRAAETIPSARATLQRLAP